MPIEATYESRYSNFSVLLDLFKYRWETNFRAKNHDPTFQNCMAMIREKVNTVWEELECLKKNRSTRDFDGLFEERLAYLHRFSSTCFTDGSEIAEGLDPLFKKIYLSPQDSLPPAPTVKPSDILSSKISEEPSKKSGARAYYPTARKTEVFIKEAGDLLDAMGITNQCP